MRNSSNAFRNSIRLWRSMLLCSLLFSVSNSSSEELLDVVDLIEGEDDTDEDDTDEDDTDVDDMVRPTLFLLWQVLWRARFAGLCSTWAALFRAGFEGGRPRGLEPGGFSLNAVLTVNWKCCWSAKLGFVGKTAGLHGLSKLTTSISSSSVTGRRKRNFMVIQTNVTCPNNRNEIFRLSISDTLKLTIQTVGTNEYFSSKIYSYSSLL